MESAMKENVKRRDTWIRGLYMLLFLLLYSLAEIVIAAVVVFQFISKAITGKTNQRLLEFGQSLSLYVYQAMRFFTYNSEEKPFPFGPWPEGEPPSSESAAQEAPEITTEEEKPGESVDTTGPITH